MITWTMALALALPACGDKDGGDDTADGAATDGGATDGGGAGDGGTTDGGGSDGGGADGGGADGGGSDGGGTDGGGSDGGGTDGGGSDGGGSDGGGSDGGGADGGGGDGGGGDGGSGVLSVGELGPGDLVISEALLWSEVSWDGGQWLEITNASGSAVDLLGLRLVAGGAWEVDESHVFADGERVLLAGTLDRELLGGAEPDLVWGDGFLLASEEEEWNVQLQNAAGSIDRVPFEASWGWWWNQSYSLDPDHIDTVDNDLPASWCAGISSYGDAGLQGTPGGANDDCPDDNDGDGYTEDVDCNDDDRSIHPGASDSAYDGVDADCAGDSDYDADRDGFDSDEYGGDDCDDSSRYVRPDAYDIPGDGIDGDCVGGDASGDPVLGIGDLAEGDLVISEIMAWPEDSEDGAWIEVYNHSGEGVLLDGLQLWAESFSCELVSSTVIPASDYIVFARSDEPGAIDGVSVDVACSSLWLGELYGNIELTTPTTRLDRVRFEGDVEMEWGASIGVEPDSLNSVDNDDLGNWCIAIDSYGRAGNRGTPGAENTCPADNDDDGHDERTDCNDEDETIHPGAFDAWYDGVDADCAGNSDYDADRDGDDAELYGGTDCDDEDPDSHLGAFDLPDDDIDQDCDGTDATGFTVLTVDDLAVGDLVITELMPWPAAAPEAAWFEVENLTGEIVLLDDLDVSTAWSAHVIEGGLVVAADDRVVFGADDDLSRNGGVPVDYEIPGMGLFGDESSMVQLAVGRRVIDAVYMRSHAWPLEYGESISLDPDATDATLNDDPANWCLGSAPFGDGDYGSPGESNPDC